MTILADSYLMPTWMTFLVGASLLALLIWENLFLRRHRLEAVVKEKRYIEQNYGGFPTAFETAGDLAFGDGQYTAPCFLLVVVAGDREVSVRTSPEIHGLAIEGSQVILVCGFGRFTRRVIPFGIELPMPAAPAKNELSH